MSQSRSNEPESLTDALKVLTGAATRDAPPTGEIASSVSVGQPSRNRRNRKRKRRGIHKMGRVYYTKMETLPEGGTAMLGTYYVMKQPATILFDPSASHTFISMAFATKHKVPMETTKTAFWVHTLRGTVSTRERVYDVPIETGGCLFPTSLIVLKDQDIDVILGMNWMQQRGAVLDTLNKTIKLRVPNKNVELLVLFHHPAGAVKEVCATPVQEVPNEDKEDGMADSEA
jgi:hypothetical protein